MKLSDKQKIKRAIFIILTLITTLFILVQSCLPAKVSSEESGWVLNFLNSITDFLGMGIVFTSHIVRKLAHFTEFAVLGIFLSLSASTYKLKSLIQYIVSLLGCLSVAVCDECIQLFTPGRAGKIQDVLLDFSGAFLGVTLVTVLVYLFSKKTKESNH